MPVAYRHIIYIHFPYLAAIRNQRVTNKTEPLVTIKKIKGIDVVIAGCVKSENFGVVAGMRLADARAICPQIIIKEHDPAADHTDLNHLAIWARRYSPLTGVDKEYGGIWLDI